MISLVPKSVIAILLSASLLGGVSTWAYWKGHSSGSATVQQKWDRERAVLLAAALEFKQDTAKRETAHRIETSALEGQLREAEAEYEKALYTVHDKYADWVQLSESRSANYRRWAEGESSQRERLADYTEKLDRSLSEGRSLVEEFRLSLGQCERDIKALGEQIKMDRLLIGTK